MKTKGQTKVVHDRCMHDFFNLYVSVGGSVCRGV